MGVNMYTGNTSELFSLPPANLMRLSVSWADNDRFLARGASAFAKVKEAFEQAGANFEGRVLEWGCGCGRIIRHVLAHGLDAHGCDINEEAISWCKNNIGSERFVHCGVNPSLPYEDQSFDFIYAGSVITHLSVDLQIYWIQELRRILKPGGYMLLTFAGTFHIRNYFGRDAVIIRALNDQPFLEVGNHAEGSNEYGIAQTIGALDIAAVGFERRSHIISHDILGAQDTAVFQKVKTEKLISFALMACEKFLDHPRAALFSKGKEIAWISGAIPNQLFLVQLSEPLSSADSSELIVLQNFSLIGIISLAA